MERAVHTCDEGAVPPVPMGPNDHDPGLHEARQHRRRGGAGDAEHGGAQLAEDQDIVEDEVHNHGDDAGLHGQHGLPALA